MSYRGALLSGLCLVLSISKLFTQNTLPQSYHFEKVFPGGEEYSVNHVLEDHMGFLWFKGSALIKV